MQEKLLTRAEVAQLLSVCLRSVDRLRAQGALPAIKVRSSVRFRPDDVRRLIGLEQGQTGFPVDGLDAPRAGRLTFRAPPLGLDDAPSVQQK
jgi:excisionase family DNA binding protein